MTPDKGARGAELVKVVADDGGVRLDRWFRRHFPHLTQGAIEKMARTGQIRLDGARAKASTRVLPGQMIRVPPQAGHHEPKKSKTAAVSKSDAAFVRSLVIYEDDDIVSLNKPSGLAVQGGSGMTRHVDALLPALAGPTGERPKLVHRLDKETSGVLVVARTAFAAAHMSAAFRGRDVLKTYWGLVHGVPAPPEGMIDSPVSKRGEGGEEAAKRARSRYTVVTSLSGKMSWLVLRPETGRTHQLRVHCSAIGHPLVGDKKYGLARTEQNLRFDGSDRLHLHGRRLRFPHPRGGRVDISADLSGHMRASWALFGLEPGLAEEAETRLDKWQG